MELLLATPGGSGQTKIDVSANTFGRDFNEALVHQVITAYMAGARAGTIRSPLWRTGGIIFAAKPQDFTQKVNRKMYRGAMSSILSELVRLNRLMIVKEAELAAKTPKTRDLLKKLESFGVNEALLIVKDWNANLYLASRNLSKVEVCEVKRIDPVSLVKYKTVVITEDAVRQIEEVLG